MVIRWKNNSVYIQKSIKSLVWLHLYYLFMYGFFRDIVGLPKTISYALDFFNIAIFFYALLHKKIQNLRGKSYKFFFLWILFFLLSTIIGLILVGGSPILYIWGFRNSFRYYGFFLSCAVLLDLSDIYEIIPVFKRIYILNLIICTVELIMGYSGDYLGGIFGTQQGSNGYLNLFMVIVTAIYVTEYLEKRNGLVKTAFIILSCFYLMAISELKVYLFELPIIVFIGMINVKFNFRKIILIMLGISGVSVGILMLGYFFEESGISFFTSDAIYKYMGDRGYTNSGDLNRFNAVPQLFKRFLVGDTSRKLFGIGLGNASYSSAFWFFNSSFYKIYNALHYQWFTDAIIYIETGAVGLLFFEGFFICIFLFARKMNRVLQNIDIGETTVESRIIVQVSCIVAFMCIINSIYNSSLSLDSAYMVYILLAAPVIVDRQMKVL
ncbi:MAG: hypothetical protein KH366_10275 [Clostridiaceae bacterium]|nr:hypothetical protein [Clostridiaceae bacterium]